MSQEQRQSALREKTRQLLEGPLKHARVISLAAALLPVAAIPAAAAPEQLCSSGGNYCGFVWSDLNGNGIQDAGEPGIEGAVISINGTPTTSTFPNGYYELLLEPGTYELQVAIPNGSVPSPTDAVDPTNPNPPDSVDSDGVLSGPNSVVTITVPDDGSDTTNTDFGFVAVSQVGTGTPGYWMNHPEAWPVATIDVGGFTFTKAEAIALLQEPGNKDKRLTMFASLVSAKLNVLIGTNPVCITGTIANADAWFATYWPVGKVAASSLAWKMGEPYHREMDNYNNGMLCAPHRD
jgi:hypothetical protein